MNMKKMRMGNTLYDVISHGEYINNSGIYNPNFTAIEMEGIVYPIVTKTSNSVGIYCGSDESSIVSVVQKPTESQAEKYSSKNIIDYSKCSDIRDVIKNNEVVRNIENDILATKDNIFSLNINQDDLPEMVAVKEAINAKHADIKQYEPRFDQFNNDLRVLTKNPSITLTKIKNFAEIFDFDCELHIKDKPGCVNPIGREIVAKITSIDE